MTAVSFPGEVGRYLCSRCWRNLPKDEQERRARFEELGLSPHPPNESSPRPHDPIKFPQYYYLPSGVQVCQVVGHLPFFRGAVVKYLLRAGEKPGEDELKDLHKAKRCLEYEIQRVESGGKIAPEKVED